MRNKALKILIIRFSSIGDIVLTSPVVRCLHQQLPNAEIYFLTKKQFQPVVAHNPYLHKVIYFENNLAEVISEIKKTSIDYIVDLHNNLRSRLIAAAFPFVKVSRFNKLNTEKWLLINFKINLLPNKHIVDRYFETVSALGIQNDHEGLDFFIAQQDAFDLNNLPELHQKGYLVFSVGGQHNTKKMPLHQWQKLAAQINFPVIVLGGKEEQETGEVLSSNFSHVINFCGKISLAQSASLIQHAAMVVTHDTGLMHIAAAFKKPMVALWGNTIPELGMYAYYGKYIIPNFQAEVKGLKCRPCSKLGYKKCPEGHFNCMQQQDINAVILFLKANLLLAFPIA